VEAAPAAQKGGISIFLAEVLLAGVLLETISQGSFRS
jgi:hypothetical protein